MMEKDMNLPSVTCGIDSRERHAAVEDLEEGLVFEHQSAHDTGRDRLGESDHGIVIDDRPLGKAESLEPER